MLSGCGKKNETDLGKKDSTLIKKDSLSTNQTNPTDKDEPSFYDQNIPFDEYVQKHPNLNKKIEFDEIIESLAVNKYAENDKRERTHPWSILADRSTSPVNWLTKGANGKRTGEVILKFSGRPIEVLDKYITPVIWKITLTGAADGVSGVNISCDILAGKLGHLDIQNLLSKKNITVNLLKSTGDASTGGKYFKIIVPNKEPMWFIYSWSCGSGGCSAGFDVYYNEDTYKSETEKQKRN